MQKVIVQEYGLDVFAKKIEDLASEGYRMDMQSNEGYPRQIGVVFTTIMYKPKDTVSSDDTPKKVKKVT